MSIPLAPNFEGEILRPFLPQGLKVEFLPEIGVDLAPDPVPGPVYRPSPLGNVKAWTAAARPVGTARASEARRLLRPGAVGVSASSPGLEAMDRRQEVYTPRFPGSQRSQRTELRSLVYTAGLDSIEAGSGRQRVYMVSQSLVLYTKPSSKDTKVLCSVLWLRSDPGKACV